MVLNLHIVLSIVLYILIDSCRGETYYEFSRTLPDQSQEPKLGDRVTIECDVQGAETVRWTADGISVTELPQQYTTNGNSLTISSFSVEYDAFYQCVARDPASSVEQLSPPILVSAFENRIFVQQPEDHIGYIVPTGASTQGYEPIAFQCELIKIYNGTKPNISWQVMEMEGGPILNYTENSGNRIVIQYDHIGYFQIHSPNMTLNGLQARCVATHPSSPTEVIYSEWALANMTDIQFPAGLDIQEGFDSFSQRPPVLYHVEEGQEWATLPCIRQIGLYQHDILWTREDTWELVFGNATDPGLVGNAELIGGTNLQLRVSNGQFFNRTFRCLIHRSDSSEFFASSTILGPAPLLPPPSFSNSTFVLSASIYGNITLTYNIGTNDSILSVWWWKNGVLILLTDQHYVSTLVGTVASLFIDDLTFQDSDLYQVLVLTSTVSRYDFFGEIGNFDLTVRAEVTFSVLDDVSINTTVGPSSTGGYTCTPSIPNGEVTTSGQLVISGRLDVSDGGTYRCTSAEINGSIVIELEAVASAYITSSSGDVVVDSGSSTTLQVTAEGIPSTITYVWKKNDVTIPGETSNTLTISSVSLRDIGQYECIPSNSEGTFNTSTIQLDVKLPTVRVDVLVGTSLPVGPSSTRGYNCTPSIPNGELTSSGQLVISPGLDINDEGIYRCTSAEINGDIVIELDIYARAYIVSSSGDVLALKGSSVVLEVTASGIPNIITYQWKKNGDIIPLQNSRSLTLSPVDTSDIGSYECIPRNSLGTHNTSVIQVDLRIPTISFSVLSITSVDQSVSSLSFSGYNCTPSIPNGEINNFGRLIINGRLDASDEGTYRCTSAEIHGDIVIELEAFASAYITSSSGDVVVDSGSSTILQVTAEGIPSTITYVWKKNGVTLIGETSNNLTISSVNVSDIGSYECTPFNSRGTFNSTVIQLDVKAPIVLFSVLRDNNINTSLAPPSAGGYNCTPSIPNGDLTSSGRLVITGTLTVVDAGVHRCTSAELSGDIVIELMASVAAYITSSSGDVVVDSGFSTTLQVTAEGIPSNITYVWKTNGVIIPGETSNTLTISSVNLSDIGQYECIPSNSEGTFNRSTIQLDVKVPTVRVDALVDTSLAVGPSSPGGYNCTPSIPNGELTSSGQLMISPGLDINDEGIYRCTSAEINGDIVIELNIYARAYIVSSSGDVLALKGSSVVLEVTASGIPDNITYQWKKNSNIIPFQMSSSLTFSPFDISDIGSYECIPSNSLGTHNTSVIQVDLRIPTISFNALSITSVDQSVGFLSSSGYNCTPSIPNGEITTSGQLVISGRLDASDEGTYRCTSAEINGDIVIELKAFASAYITSSSGDVVVDSGFSTTLQVTAEGIPSNITYVWKTNGVIIPGETSNTLTISSVGVSNIGSYECIPSNSRGTFNSTVIQLDVKVPLVSINILDDVSTSQPVGPSSPGGYNCTPSIPNGELTSSGQLMISPGLDINDEGIYRCTSAEINGDIVIELNIYARAYIVSSSGNVLALRGSSVVLEVTASGIPDNITYQWKKNSNIIPFQMSSSLTFSPFDTSDIGSYECIPSNSLGTHNTSVIQVDLRIPLFLINILDDVSISQPVGPSSTGGYNCTPSIPNGEVTTSGQLVISGRLDVSDEGTYRCTSAEIHGSIIIELETYEPGFVIPGPNTVIAKNGSMVSLFCNAKGTVTTYVWKKDGIVIRGASSSYLNIDKVNLQDVGHYECIPYNSFGNHNSSEITINIQIELTLDWLTNYSVSLLPSVSSPYTCDPLLRRGRINAQGILRTGELRLRDSAIYFCTSNGFNGSFLLNLTVKGYKPEAPVLDDPVLTDDATAISLMWNYTGGRVKPVSQYILFWRVESESRSKRQSSSSSDSRVVRGTSYNLTNYTREAVYTFWVAAENGVGQSDLSNRIRFDVELQYRRQFQTERERGLEVWVIVLMVLLCLLCCCICCLLWCILCCCVIGKKRVYHAEEEEKKYVEEMESYRKKGEDEESDSEDETDDDADVEEEEGEITGNDPQEKSGGGDTAEPV